MTAAKSIIQKTLVKWRLLRISEIMLIALGVSVLVYFTWSNFWVSTGSFLVIALLTVLWGKLWQYGQSDVCIHLDRTVKVMEHSTSLLLEPQNKLSVLAKIQQSKMADILQDNKNQIRLKHNLWRNFIIAAVFVGLGVFLQNSGFLDFSGINPSGVSKEDAITFTPLDTLVTKVVPPAVNSQSITVSYPVYTGKAAFTTSELNLKVLGGSYVNWAVGFDKNIKEAWLQFGSDALSMDLKNDSYEKGMRAKSSSFYTLKFLDSLGNVYLSNLYALEVYADESPVVTMNDLPQFSTFEVDSPQVLEFTTNIRDDFGIGAVAIIATVSKGSGEAVKFREERLAFDTPFQKGFKSSELRKKIDLQTLKMEPGDELYFYVEVKDNREPKPNITRTETYFSVIKDTVTDAFAVEGTMGADLMPDYFRSQRQLIIDTEKLIAEKSTLKKKEFDFRSNELGFDQKALRLKYGQFMGDENEAPSAPKEIGEATIPEDMLDDYSHKHDGDNEHNLVVEEDDGHDHDNEAEEGAEEDPLEAYIHNHEDPEASTLFAKSLRSMLKNAMSEMWDAELYLRLYKPEKSLPYQYEALKLIQEIKNSARIYVHRIGFDPPPIKEDKRLTGELKEVKGFSKTEELEREEVYPKMMEALELLELVLSGKDGFSENDRVILQAAGDELAVLAIAEPSAHLNTLQALKWLSESKQINIDKVNTVHAGLLRALPEPKRVPSGNDRYQGKLNQLFLEALETNE
jgi:hypothetical protein